MKTSTKLTLGLVAAGTCACAGAYLYFKNKEKEPLAIFTDDFFEDVSDGSLEEVDKSEESEEATEETAKEDSEESEDEPEGSITLNQDYIV